MGRKREDEKRLPVALSCTVCGSRNYKTTRARGHEGQLQLKKFCRVCEAHTLHVDGK
ncbi:MAG: 50S ribosomal protein L33 [Polyangiaceae bacterium]|nr:50S ribosomal protein L33 [Polyangiaceae bacterium]